MKRLRRAARRILWWASALFLLFVVLGVVFVARCRTGGGPLKQASAAALERRKATADIKDYARPEVDTYLSYPEWYIVWSYQEKADYQETHLPTRYPFFGNIRQYWSGYCCVFGFTRGRYAPDWGAHVMLAVIGSSFSAEYAIKGIYEGTVGRFTEWLSGHETVEEDRYAYRVAREYADFVHIRPFYEFSFWKRFKGLWSQTRLWGPHPVRQWERKVFLSVDYSFEAFYCWLIEQMTHASYGYEPSDTYAWIENATEEIFGGGSHIRKVKQVGPGAFVVIIPRYQEFTTIASELAHRGVRFVEIAGNDEVLLSAIAPRGWSYDVGEGEVLFTADILTRPDARRVVLRVPVAALSNVLNGLAERKVRLEHVYDF